MTLSQINQPTDYSSINPGMTGETKMRTPEIIEGQCDQVCPSSGDWLIVDIGMAMKRRSSGVWHGPGTLCTKSFGELLALAIRKVEERCDPPLNLLIEAPLSVARQQDGAPAGRKFEKRESEHRYWYEGGGATTLLAAQFLLRKLYECQTTQRKVRLFEAFVSFKNKNAADTATPAPKAANSDDESVPANLNEDNEEPFPRNSHERDVLKLKRAVWVGDNAKVLDPRNCLLDTCDYIESPFPFLERKLIPPVILITPDL